MPEVSRFFGIVITIYHREHPPPHFHARYGSNRAAFSIRNLAVVEGGLPRRVTSMVLEWAFEHREELLHDWELAAQKRPLRPISPLE